MEIVGTSRKFGKGDKGVTNVGTACNVGKKKFTKESAVGKTMLGSKSSMGRSAFEWTGVGIHGSDGISR